MKTPPQQGPFTQQVANIKEKLDHIRGNGLGKAVFGAGSHKYQMNSPATEEEVKAFQDSVGVQLPSAYRAFILEIGNGGAGPYYGMHPLGTRDFLDDLEDIAKPSPLIPGMTEAEWDEFTWWSEDNELANEVYNEKYNSLFHGLLPVGNQGCACHHLLVVTGPFKGRIVNFSQDISLPQFAYDDHFLDWYERWLDKIIAGEKFSWFGYEPAPG